VNTVVGLIDTRSEAEKVVHDLVVEGIERNHIHVVAGDTEPEATTATGEDTGFRGLLVKLGLLESRRRELGLPAEHIGYYSEGVRRGSYLVTVDVDSEDETDRAVDVLEDHGAVNIEERAAEWQKSGWSGYGAGKGMADVGTVSTAGTTATVQPAREGEAARIPVVEEELKVGKRAVQKGGVRVYTHVTEQPVSEQVTLREEHVDVQRRPVDRPLSEADMAAFKEGTIELTETAEEAVAAKEARVVEEVVVSKGVTEHTETVQDTVRRTDVEVEPLGKGAGTAVHPIAFEDYDTGFRQHYTTHFGSTGEPYARYEPAYRFGYTLANDPAYSGRDWAAVETDARSQWEKRSVGTWDKMKNAIHHAWDKVRGHR
jgi:uncharacterized protein (TIGR02271 family)